MVRKITFPVASNYTPELIAYARAGVEAIYRTGDRYKKDGVIMLALVAENLVQGNLFALERDSDKERALMAVNDRLNERFEKETLRFLAAGIQRSWLMKNQRRSPRYTIRWDELPIVRADFQCN